MLTPQRVDQPVDGDDSVGIEKQQREHRALLLSPE
jgi:hypothetical protein